MYLGDYNYLLDIFCGSFLFSFGLNHAYAVAGSNNQNISYSQYPAIVVIFVIGFFTLFFFYIEYVKTIDDKSLLKYDVNNHTEYIDYQPPSSLLVPETNEQEINFYSTDPNNEIDYAPSLVTKSKHFLSDIPIILYYTISFMAALSLILYLASCDQSTLSQNTPYFILHRLFESIILNYLLKRLSISISIYAILVTVYGLLFFLIFIPINNSKAGVTRFNEICYIPLSGIYFAFGGLLLQNGISASEENTIFLSIGVLVISSIAPYFLKIGIKYDNP